MRIAIDRILNGTAVLQQRGWFSQTPPEFQAVVLARCTWDIFQAGETLIWGGDREGGIFGLAEGSTSVTAANGAADVPPIHIVRPPSWFGLNPLVAGEARNVTVTARSESLVAQVPQHVLAAIMAQHPEYWRLTGLLLVETVAISVQAVADLMLRDNRRRCIAVLLRVADCRNSGDSLVEADIGQEELAAMSNLSRQTVAPILHELARAGLVTLGYRTIVLPDPATLRTIVDA